MYSVLFLALASFAVCLVLTPLIRDWFRAHGVLDHPDEERRLHAFPIPRVGGIAIALSYVAALGLLLVTPLRGAASLNLIFIAYLLPAAAVVFATGLLDDLMGLSPWEKLIGQIGAACLAYWGGVRISSMAGFSIGDWWGLPLTVIWLVACANAFNLIDGVDGLATGVGLFATMTIFVAALLHNLSPLALATAPLAGALLAFLRYNFNPASIFLGDSGSLTIGFLLGCYGVIWGEKSATLLGMTAPLMALSVPLLDATLAIVRRFLRHQPIFGADRNHIHHRLLDRGFSPRRVALVLYGVSGLVAALSLLQTMPNNKFSGLIIVVFCAAAWVGVQHLGYGEFGTARKLVLQGTFRSILDTQIYMMTFEKDLKEAATPDACWNLIRKAARDYGFAQIRLHLSGGFYEETFNRQSDLSRCCTTRVPLSEWEYANFTHNPAASMKQLLAVASLVDILRRALGSRLQEFPPASTDSGEMIRPSAESAAAAQGGGD